MTSPNYLSQIMVYKKKEIDRLIRLNEIDLNHHLNKVLSKKRGCQGCFSSSLKGEKLSVIAEVKRRSPTCGEIRKIDDPVELALRYCKGGASAISVLTDFDGFGGSLKDLQQVSEALSIQYPHVPVLRKDFIIHPLQLVEAVIAGASTVLLIANLLKNNLGTFIQKAASLGLEVLTEVHDEADLELALEAEAPIIGINHRNLATFEIDLSCSERLRPLIPHHLITVAESGIRDERRARHMRKLGYNAILVGEALVRAENPDQLIEDMRRG